MSTVEDLLGAMSDDETESDDDVPLPPATTTAHTSGASGSGKPSRTGTRITLSALAADSDTDSDGDLEGGLLPAAPLPGRRAPRTSSGGASADASLASAEPSGPGAAPASVSSAATSGVEDPSLAPSTAVGASSAAVDQSAVVSETGSEASAAGREAGAARATLFAYFADKSVGADAALSVDACLKLLRAAKMIDASLSAVDARRVIERAATRDDGPGALTQATFSPCLDQLADARYPTLAPRDARAMVNSKNVAPAAARIAAAAPRPPAVAPASSTPRSTTRGLLPMGSSPASPARVSRKPATGRGARPVDDTDEDDDEDDDETGDSEDDGGRQAVWEQNMSAFAASSRAPSTDAGSHDSSAAGDGESGRDGGGAGGIPYAETAGDVPARGLEATARSDAPARASGASGEPPARPGRYVPPRKDDQAFGGEADRGAWRKQVGGYPISTAVTDDDLKNMSFKPRINKNYHFDGEDLDFKTRQEMAEERRQLRLMQLKQVAWEAEEAAKREAMGVSGGSRRLLRKTGLARETQRDAIQRLYAAHQERAARPPPPPVDPQTGQRLFQPVVNHRQPRTGASSFGSTADDFQGEDDRAGGGGGDAGSVGQVTALTKQRAAMKLYDNALAKLSRQADSVQIQRKMDRAQRNTSKMNRASKELLRRKLAKELCAVVTTLTVASGGALDALRRDMGATGGSAGPGGAVAQTGQVPDSGAAWSGGYADEDPEVWTSQYTEWARQRLDFPQLAEVLRRMGFIRTTDHMVHAVETGSSPWPWATMREQSMMLKLWGALIPQLDEGNAAAEQYANVQPRSGAGGRDGNWVYVSRLLSLLQAVMTGRADVTMPFLHEMGQWVLAGPASVPGDRHRGRRAAPGTARPPVRWGARSVGGSTVGGGDDPAGVGPGEMESKAKGAAAGDMAAAPGAAAGADGGRGDDDLALSSDDDDDDDDDGDFDMNLNGLAALTARNAAKLEAIRAEAQARAAGRLPLAMTPLDEDGGADGAGGGDGAGAGDGVLGSGAPPRSPGDGAGMQPRGDGPDAISEELLDEMGIGVIWNPEVVSQLAELRTSRVAVVGAKVTVKDGGDTATVASVVGPVASAASVPAGNEEHTFAPLLCDKSRKIDAKVSRSNVPRQEKLINYARQAEQRRRQVKKQLLAKQRENCTFQPNTSATRSYRAKKGAGRGRGGGEEPASERLYKLHTLRQAKLKRERKRLEAAAKEAEVEECTFKPEIHPSPAVRSVVATSHSVSSHRRSGSRASKPDTARKVPRGYAKSIDRLRRGQARREEDKKIEQQLRQGMVSKKALVRDSRGNTKVAPFSLATSKRTRERQQHAAAADAKRRDRMQFIRKAKMEANQAARAAQLSAHRAQQRADMDMLMPNTFGNALVAPLMYVDVNITPEHTERIAVWEGEDVRTVARRFSIQHGLSGRTTDRLADMLAAKKTAVLAARASEAGAA